MCKKGEPPAGARPSKGNGGSAAKSVTVQPKLHAKNGEKQLTYTTTPAGVTAFLGQTWEVENG